jgi:hypothetical protein
MLLREIVQANIIPKWHRTISQPNSDASLIHLESKRKEKVIIEYTQLHAVATPATSGCDLFVHIFGIDVDLMVFRVMNGQVLVWNSANLVGMKYPQKVNILWNRGMIFVFRGKPEIFKIITDFLGGEYRSHDEKAKAHRNEK